MFLIQYILLLLITVSLYNINRIIKPVDGYEDKTIGDELMELKYSSLSLKNLPETFSNEKLPNPNQTTNICFDFLGCYERIPISEQPMEPLKLNTTFSIFRRGSFTDIDFRPLKICLKDSSQCEIYPYNLDLLANARFNPRKRTIIITPGYKAKTFTQWQQDFKDRWLALEDVNVILVGWEGGNHVMYDRAVANTKTVARQLTALLYYLAILNNLSLTDESFSEKLQLVGHSLGAHISGFVGKDFNGSVGRITGLDPAGPEFRGFTSEYRLDKTDGQLVDVLHTNGCPLSIIKPCYGIEEPIGHVDFYANNGKHQPQCNSDAFGCSHGASIDYYRSFLDHEKYTREYLDRNYHDCHRLFAIRGSNYEDYHRGISLSRMCPITSLDDYDLHSKDIADCTIPIDFITNYGKLKKELIEKYNINFDPSIPSKAQYFFYTSPAFPFINNHNLIKIRVTKEADYKDKTNDIVPVASNSKVCDLILHVKMENGAWMKNEIKQYQLLDEVDHYEVILPYISTVTASKYELARLDANDFYLNETDHTRLLSGIKVAFPKSVELTGLQVKRENNKNRGVFDIIKDFFGLGQGDKEQDENGEIFHDCDLSVESITIQPFKKIHRHFVAAYTLDAFEKEDPGIVVLSDNERSPKIDLLHGRRKDTTSENAGKLKSETFIDTVILGPRDTTIDPKEPQIIDGNEGETSFDDNYEDKDRLNGEESVGNTTKWLILAISTILITVILMTVILYTGLEFKGFTAQDKEALVANDQLSFIDIS